MNAKFKYIALLAAIVFIFAVGSQLRGETLDMDLFTAEAPAGWTAGPAEGAFVVFDPEETISLIINYTEYAYPDPAVMAKRLGTEYAVKTLDESAGFVFSENSDDGDYRFWRGLSPEGQSLEISVHGSHEKLAELLQSLAVSAEARKEATLAAQLQTLLDNLKKPEVISWLTGSAPLSADPPPAKPEADRAGEPAETVPWRGDQNLGAQVPKSWSIDTEKGRTRFSSPDRKEQFTVIPLTSLKVVDFGDDFDRYQAGCAEEVHKIGGVNIRSAEGTVFFDLPDLSEGEVFNRGDNSFILIRQGSSPELEALHWSLFE